MLQLSETLHTQTVSKKCFNFCTLLLRGRCGQTQTELKSTENIQNLFLNQWAKLNLKLHRGKWIQTCVVLDFCREILYWNIRIYQRNILLKYYKNMRENITIHIAIDAWYTCNCGNGYMQHIIFYTIIYTTINVITLINLFLALRH